MNKIAVLSVFGGAAIFAVLLANKAKATELTKPPATNNQRPYENPNGDKGSIMMNNPLNIKWNAKNNWVGQTGKNANGFAIFDTPQNCYRAGAKILASYAKRGIDTVPEIIKTWAPPSDNNPTESYIDFVCAETGFNRIQTITNQNYVDLFIAMTKFETGKFPYSRSVVQSGVRAA